MPLQMFLLCAVFLLLSGQTYAEEHILRPTTDDVFPLSTPEADGVNVCIIAEALRRTGYGLDVLHLPSERALLNADAGLADGNGMRSLSSAWKMATNFLHCPPKTARISSLIPASKATVC